MGLSGKEGADGLGRVLVGFRGIRRKRSRCHVILFCFLKVKNLYLLDARARLGGRGRALASGPLHPSFS